MVQDRPVPPALPGDDPRDRPLRDLLGKTAGRLKDTRGMTTVGHLLDWLPRRYIDPSRPQAFREVPMGEDVVVIGTVRDARTIPMRNRRGKRLMAVVVDEQGAELELAFFQGTYVHEKRLVPGARVVCSGQISTYGHRLQLTHPEYAVLGDPSGRAGSGRWLLRGPIPVYTATKRLSPIVHGDSLDIVLHAVAELPDPLPAEVRERHALPGLLEAYRLVHRPTTQADHRLGVRRLKFQEAFVVQAQLARVRMSSGAAPATPRVARPGGLVDALRDQLPFDLTAGQETVLAELVEDLSDDRPMHRLLQGEVGSGKTVLALLAMLAVVDAGGQAALLAPTEVLAVQHHRSLTHLLGPLAEGGMLGGHEDGTRVSLLTGSQSAGERKAALLSAASGEAGIVVGTHALIQDHVQFAELGLVVVDEQHRFGVEQRDALRAKAGAVAPHVLVMTATPIPRTVAMTVYGDMAISTLRELPRGRQPISSFVVEGQKADWVRRTWERVAEEVAAGGQVYVVCPRIGESGDPDLPGATDDGPGLPIPAVTAGDGGEGADGTAGERAPADEAGRAGEDGAQLELLPVGDQGGAGVVLHGVHQVTRSLQMLPATAHLAVAALHGRMTPEDKDGVMRAFTGAETDILVSTTVIEVGVDVPDATTMVVLDADRFGISQLHQLRGRVGRGGKAGLCLLVTQGGEPATLERLHRVAATTDGFELARVDLESRREGDVLGASQSGGRSGLRFLRLARDEELIVTAHEEAWGTVEADPDLSAHPALVAELERLGTERAAFLERG